MNCELVTNILLRPLSSSLSTLGGWKGRCWVCGGCNLEEIYSNIEWYRMEGKRNKLINPKILILKKKIPNFKNYRVLSGCNGYTRSGIGLPDTRKHQILNTRTRPVSRFCRVAGTCYPPDIGSGQELPATRFDNPTMEDRIESQFKLSLIKKNI